MKRRLQVHATGSGYLLAPILLAMFWAAVNYDNNLVYLVLFTLLAMALVSIVHTRSNLLGLELSPGNVWPAFAGETMRLAIQAHNRSSRPRFGIRVDQEGRKGRAIEPADVASIPANGSATIELLLPVTARGRYELGDLRITSTFPMGIAIAEATLPAGIEYIVYPAPSGSAPMPPPESDYRHQDDGSRPGAGDDFYGVRPYHPGEPQRRIDWKAVARGRPMMVKEYSGGGTGRLWFDFAMLGGLDMEERLSQLARWVVDADEMEACYGLRLPSISIDPGVGPVHYHACLRALALYRS